MVKVVKVEVREGQGGRGLSCLMGCRLAVSTNYKVGGTFGNAGAGHVDTNKL